MTERMLRAVQSPHTDILGHCTGRLLAGRAGRSRASTPRPSRRVRGERHRGRDQLATRAPRPAEDLLALALEAGCVFSIDSDAHAPGS